jgi:hypothetical protein
MRPLYKSTGAVAVGIVVAYLWEFLNAEIVGYLALWRFSDHWPLWAHIALPALLFLGIAALSHWILVLVLRDFGIAAIWASIVAFGILMLYAHMDVETGIQELAFSVTLIGAAVLSGVVVLKLWRRVRTT